MEKILEIKNLTKKYPGVTALDNVSMSFDSGEIHALIGENGAGKSTLIKAIAGAINFDNGVIEVNGEKLTDFSPKDAINRGISIIYQEFNVIPSMSVAENIFIGENIGGKYLVDFEEMHRRAEEIFSQFEVKIDTKEMVFRLSTAQMQIVEIAKAISKNVKVLFMDEPSATLSLAEVQHMFDIVRHLKSSGVSVVFVSHRLDEVFQLCDRVTVMRDGKYIATKKVSETSRKELISLMVGRDLVEKFPIRKNNRKEVTLEAKNLTGNGVRDISFKLHKGEILGFGGLVGSGRTELAKMLYGAAVLEEGQIKVNQSAVKIKNPSHAIKLGIGLIPEDRKLEGIFADYRLDWNIVIMSLKRIAKRGILRDRDIKKLSEQYSKDLQIVSPSLKQLVKNLSGGNQQKVVVARVLAAQTKIIIFDEPTRGIDVGAKQEIYRLMNDLTDQGISIIMISSEMEELLGMSDRIIVLREGIVSGELSKEEYSQEAVLELASFAN